MYYKALDYKNFSSVLIDKTMKLGIEHSLSDVNDYIICINDIFNICETPKVTNVLESSSDNGCYVHCNKEIIFYNKLNLIKTLHEIRHYIQFNTKLIDILDTYDKREIDARAWSSSLFYACFPHEYLKLTNLDYIKYV